MNKYGVNFDVGFYVEVEAENADEAIEKAKDNISKAEEGEAHAFEAERIKFFSFFGGNKIMIDKKTLKWINAVLQNDETATDDELAAYFQQNGLTSNDAAKIVSQRQKCLSDPFYCVTI